jgi:hypothetical protein
MNRFFMSLGCSAFAALSLGLSGCNSNVPEKTTQPAAGSAVESHEGHAHSPADLEKAKAELAKLSPEERGSAEKQHVCPVTGEMLGSMGPPKKVDVKGQQVWICCDGCREELQANPDKYLAKLKKG